MYVRYVPTIRDLAVLGIHDPVGDEHTTCNEVDKAKMTCHREKEDDQHTWVSHYQTSHGIHADNGLHACNSVKTCQFLDGLGLFVRDPGVAEFENVRTSVDKILFMLDFYANVTELKEDSICYAEWCPYLHKGLCKGYSANCHRHNPTQGR